MKRLILLTFTLLVSTLHATTLTPITVALDWYINPDQAPLLIAQTQGYFAQHDLKVTLLTPTEETEPMKLVEVNQATFGITNQLSLLQALSAGAPLIRIAGLAVKPMSCVATLNSNIHTIKDLTGKTIGYSAGGSLSPEILRQWLKNNGVDPTTVKLINVKMDLVQALLTHRIDAAADVVRSVEVVELEQMGYHPTVFLPEQSGVPTYEEMLLIDNTRHLNPKTIKAFIAALTEAEHYLAANPEQSWKIASQYYKSALAATPEMTKTNHAIWLATVPYFGTDPTAFNAKQYQAFNAFLVQISTLQQSIPLSRYTIGS